MTKKQTLAKLLLESDCDSDVDDSSTTLIDELLINSSDSDNDNDPQQQHNSSQNHQHLLKVVDTNAFDFLSDHVDAQLSVSDSGSDRDGVNHSIDELIEQLDQIDSKQSTLVGDLAPLINSCLHDQLPGAVDDVSESSDDNADVSDNQALDDVLNEVDISDNDIATKDTTTSTLSSGGALFEPGLNSALIKLNVPPPPINNLPLYTRWICQYRPDDLLEYTRTHINELDVIHVQQLCAEYNIFDTLSYIYEQQGQTDQSLAVLLNTYNNSIQSIVKSIEIYPPSDYSIAQHNALYTVKLCSDLCIREHDDFQLYCAVLDTLFDSYTNTITDHTILRTLVSECVNTYIDCISIHVDPSQLIQHLLDNHINTVAIYISFQPVLVKLLKMCTSEYNIAHTAFDLLRFDVDNNVRLKYNLLCTPQVHSNGVCSLCKLSFPGQPTQLLTAYMTCKHVLHNSCTNSSDIDSCAVCYPHISPPQQPPPPTKVHSDRITLLYKRLQQVHNILK